MKKGYDKMIRKACQCSICELVLAIPVTWPCGHSFCKSCSFTIIKNFSDKNNAKVKCPTCHADNQLNIVENLPTNLVLHELLIYEFGLEKIQRREAKVHKALRKLEVMLDDSQKGGDEVSCSEHSDEEDEDFDDRLGYRKLIGKERYDLCNNVSVERNVVQPVNGNLLMTLAPVEFNANIPTLKTHFSTWTQAFAVLWIKEVGEDISTDDCSGFLHMVRVEEGLTLEDLLEGDHDDQMVYTEGEGAMMCYQVFMDGKELGFVGRTEITHGVAIFGLYEVFENVQIKSGAKFELRVIVRDDGLSSIFRFIFRDREYSHKRNLLQMKHNATAESNQPLDAGDRKRQSMAKTDVDDDADEQDD